MGDDKKLAKRDSALVRETATRYAVKEVLYWGAGVVGLSQLWAHLPFYGKVGAVAGVVSLRWIWRRVRRWKLYYQWKVSQWSGIRRVYPVRAWKGKDVRTEQRKSAEEALVEVVRVAPRVRLLLASGYRHIGTARNPGLFFEMLDNRQPPFTLEVLLMDPAKTHNRPKLAGLSDEAYSAGIQAVLWTLAQWGLTRGISVTVSLYEEEPIWQMVITDSELWLLCAKGVPADASTVYCLSLEADFGLALGLQAVWDRRVGTAQAVSLAEVKQPNWDIVTSVPKAGEQLR